MMMMVCRHPGILITESQMEAEKIEGKTLQDEFLERLLIEQLTVKSFSPSLTLSPLSLSFSCFAFVSF